MPNDEAEPLRAIGVYAAEKRVKLPFDQVSRIARVTADPGAVLPHLVRDRDVTPDQLIDTMALLGAPHDALRSGPGAESIYRPIRRAGRSLKGSRPQGVWRFSVGDGELERAFAF